MSKIDESKDPPNQTPSIPINGFLNLGGIKTFTLNKAKIATKKAGPKTHGRGKSKKLNIPPPIRPIKSVIKIYFIDVNILFL